MLGRGREAELVVDDQVDRAADSVAGDVAHVEALGDDTLAGERGVAVHEDRQHRVRARTIDHVLARPRHAPDDGVDCFEVRRVCGELDLDVSARRAHELARRPEVVFDVARALRRRRVDVALELTEDLVVGLADDVRQHAQTAAVGHAEHHSVETLVRCRRKDRVEDGDRRFGSFEAEALLSDVLRGEEPLERLGGVQAGHQVQLLFVAEHEPHAFDLLLDPLLLGSVLDVHVLDADRAAVGVAQDPQDLAELELFDSAESAREELALEVPDREAVGGGIELGLHPRRLPLQRIEVGDEVTAHAVDADERRDHHLLLKPRVVVVGRVDVAAPAHRLVGNTERSERGVVEAAFADQQLVHPLEEQTRLGTLDHAVVVGGRDRHDLRHTQVGERPFVGGLILGREVDRADPDDDALAGHEPRHRLHGADRPGVRQRDRGPLEVVEGQLVRAHLADEVLVRGDELGERHLLGGLHDGHHEGAAAVGLLDVDGDPQVQVLVADDSRLAVDAFEVGRVHDPCLVRDRAHHGIPDEVGEAHLPAPRAGQVAVDDAAVDLEQLRRHDPEARRRGDTEAGFHVRDDHGARAADRVAGLVGRRSRGRGAERAQETGLGAGVGAGAGDGAGAGAMVTAPGL